MAIQYNSGTDVYQNWIVAEDEFSTAHLGKFEAIFSLGNGYMGVRSATEEHYLGEVRGCYIAGLFDEYKGEVTELPNLPDWTAVEISLKGERFNLETGNILSYNRRLNLKDGELVREIEWESPQGHRTKLSFRRCVSLAEYHLAGLRIEITPLNYAGEVRITTGFDGQVTNSGVQHFVEGQTRVFQERRRYYMAVTTQESNLDVVLAAQHHNTLNGKTVEAKEIFRSDRRRIMLISNCSINKGDVFVFEKLVTIYTGRDKEFLSQTPACNDVMAKTLAILEQEWAKGYHLLCEESRAAWQKMWEKMDISIDGPDFDQLAVRFAQYHLVQMTPMHDSRFSVAAKGLSGEGYKGHVFWDTEIFILPFFIYTFPDIARKLVEYRYQTIEGARKKAREGGFRGAMYAWESAFTGEETTPKWSAIDIVTGEPIRIWCGEIEQHITVDVVFGIWHYFQVTGDIDFMLNYGFEIHFDTANFWISRLEYNQEQDRYEIHNIIGPDEYGEHVNNNAYTNRMVQWHLRKAVEFSDWLKTNDDEIWKQLNDRLHMEQHQPEWAEKAEKMHVAIDEETGIIPQYDGFMEQPEIDLTLYKGKVGAIFNDYGWEDIVKSQVLKQADVVMLLYHLGDGFSQAIKRANWDFYEPKTLHDSSLSTSIHSILANDMKDSETAYQYFEQASRIDLGENMNSSDAGLHAASLGGIWQAVVNGFGGVRMYGETLHINPLLPAIWKSLGFSITWKGETLHISVDRKRITLKKADESSAVFLVNLYGQKYEFSQKLTAPYNM